jgi:hypothetical protein
MQNFIVNLKTLNEIHIELIKLSLDSIQISKLKSSQMNIILFFFGFNMVIVPIEIG